MSAGGWHVEIGNNADYYALDWSKSFETLEDSEAKLNSVM